MKIPQKYSNGTGKMRGKSASAFWLWQRIMRSSYASVWFIYIVMEQFMIRSPVLWVAPENCMRCYSLNEWYKSRAMLKYLYHRKRMVNGCDLKRKAVWIFFSLLLLLFILSHWICAVRVDFPLLWLLCHSCARCVCVCCWISLPSVALCAAVLTQYNGMFVIRCCFPTYILFFSSVSRLLSERAHDRETLRESE